MEKLMNLGTIFNEVLLTEMARGDLKGAGKALINKDWAKAAKIYVTNARDRGLDDSKVVSGLGATFRSKKGETTVTVGKTDDGTSITLESEDVVAMKKAVKGFMGYKTKASQKKKTSEEKAPEQSKKDSKKEKQSDKVSFLDKGSVEEGTKNKAIKEIFKNIDYVEASLDKKEKKNKSNPDLSEAFETEEFKAAVKEIIKSKSKRELKDLFKD